MPLVETEFTATAQTGTLSEFGSMSLVENLASAALDDGRTVEIYRSYNTGMSFELRIEGEGRTMKIPLKPLLENAVAVFAEMTAPEKGGAA